MKRFVSVCSFILAVCFLTSCSVSGNEDEKEADPTYGTIQYLNRSSYKVTGLYIMPYSTQYKDSLAKATNLLTGYLPYDYYFDSKCETGSYMIAYEDINGPQWLLDIGSAVYKFNVEENKTISIGVRDTSWYLAKAPFTSSSIRSIVSSEVFEYNVGDIKE